MAQSATGAGCVVDTAGELVRSGVPALAGGALTVGATGGWASGVPAEHPARAVAAISEARPMPAWRIIVFIEYSWCPRIAVRRPSACVQVNRVATATDPKSDDPYGSF
ncbi:hypothetical protein AFM11_27750 [Mycolicibacterium wolinskyi]|uniref:Uncharacterized protein n=1 Tax=Mycolicibacterium wolinskyi TaxID=59750 RepID=A0A132PEY1_9MYCO|nr:hypothetical protein AFM11_27750 [Mycolicibacterium wolinskyi]